MHCVHPVPGYGGDDVSQQPLWDTHHCSSFHHRPYLASGSPGRHCGRCCSCRDATSEPTAAAAAAAVRAYYLHPATSPWHTTSNSGMPRRITHPQCLPSCTTVAASVMMAIPFPTAGNSGQAVRQPCCSHCHRGSPVLPHPAVPCHQPGGHAATHAVGSWNGHLPWVRPRSGCSTQRVAYSCRVAWAHREHPAVGAGISCGGHPDQLVGAAKPGFRCGGWGYHMGEPEGAGVGGASSLRGDVTQQCQRRENTRVSALRFGPRQCICSSRWQCTCSHVVRHAGTVLKTLVAHNRCSPPMPGVMNCTRGGSTLVHPLVYCKQTTSCWLLAL